MDLASVSHILQNLHEVYDVPMNLTLVFALCMARTPKMINIMGFNLTILFGDRRLYV